MRRPKNPTPRAGCEPDASPVGVYCCPTLTANPDGSFTFNRGDGSGVPSGPVIIPAPGAGGCCPTLVSNGNGLYTFTPGNGGPPVIINAAPPTLALTNGTLTVTANGGSATANLRGNLVQDIATLDLGYLLPL